ncbi:XRE family transcriptional regulator [Rhizobium ruizarguesonis]|jgi:transcriptional regulator with XRE-family HTH domain|nr:XRE family transcriptional regulator [Rhizobium ruizarguesonis]
MQEMELHLFLKDWRKQYGMTQAVAARELNIALPTYRGLEQGRPTPYEQVIVMATKHWQTDGGPLRMLIENARAAKSAT